MNLKDHAGLELAFTDEVVDPDHGDLHDVAGGALDRVVDGRPDGALPHGVDRALQLRHVAAAAEQRLGITGPLRLANNPILILLHCSEALEVALNEAGRLGRRQLGARGEAKLAHAVEDPEVDNLRESPHVRRDLVWSDTHHLGSGRRVNVQSLAERLQQAGVLRLVSQDAQLDLAVVGAQQLAARGAWNERSAHAPAKLSANRDVLQVWL